MQNTPFECNKDNVGYSLGCSTALKSSMHPFCILWDPAIMENVFTGYYYVWKFIKLLPHYINFVSYLPYLKNVFILIFPQSAFCLKDKKNSSQDDMST